jgi:hypothetical protein
MLDRLVGGTPVAELELLAPYLLGRPASLLDYLPAATLVAIDEPDGVHLAGTQLVSQAEELREQFEQQGELPAGLRQPYHDWAAMTRAVQRRATLSFSAAPASGQAEALVALGGFGRRRPSRATRSPGRPGRGADRAAGGRSGQ